MQWHTGTTMKPIIPVLVGILVVSLLCAGCATPDTFTTPTPTVTSPTLTPSPTTMIPVTTSIPSLTPGPTVTVPANFDTNIGIYQDDPTRTIYVRYNGGKSQILLQKIEVRVITSKGKVITESTTNEEGQIPTGYTFSIDGSSGVNRVEVTVTINAVPYKIVDTTVLFR
jgi:hypothetical protein